MVVHEGVESGAKTLGKFVRSAGDEVAEVVGLEAQPEAFDGVEVWTVARQELALEVVPMEPSGFVPGSVVEDEDAPLVRIGRDGFRKVVEVALEDVGIDSIEDPRFRATPSRRPWALRSSA